MPLVGDGQPILADAPLGVATNAKSPRDMRILVITADGKETDLGAIKADLDSVGVPYTVLTASTTPLTAAMLWDGVGHGYYQGVIMTTNSLTYSPDERHDLAERVHAGRVQHAVGLRVLVRRAPGHLVHGPFGWPETLGLSAPVATIDTTATPLATTLTATGRTVFNYLNPDINLPIGNAWVYQESRSSTRPPRRRC